MKKIGVLDIQGSVEEHLAALRQLHVQPVLVKSAEQIDALDGLIIPGGESTTISKLLFEHGIAKAIRKRKKQLPLWGTCAGAIILAKRIKQYYGGRKPRSLKLMNMTIERNAYGRQIESFETNISIPAIEEKGSANVTGNGNGNGNGAAHAPLAAEPSSIRTHKKRGIRQHSKPVPTVFIRAPKVKRIGRRVHALATLNGSPVMLQEGRYMATMFHPELTDDLRIHKYFVTQLCNGTH